MFRRLYLQTTLHLSKRFMFIKNGNTKSCVDCIHFSEQPDRYPYDPPSDLGYCKLFGEKDVVYGDIKYEFAAVCRIDDSKCGVTAKHFKPIDSEDEK